MSLQARLDRIRAGFEKDAPAEVLAVMRRAAEELEASGIMGRVARQGQDAPDFTLDDSLGRPVELAELRSRGPVVLTFFRGDW